MVATHLAIHIEHSPAIIHRDSFLAVEPGAQPTNPGVDGWEISTDEKQELDEVKANQGMPKEGLDRSLRLCRRVRTRCVKTRGGDGVPHPCDLQSSL